MNEVVVDAYEINTEAWLVKCVFIMVAKIMGLSGQCLLFVTCPAHSVHNFSGGFKDGGMRE